MNRAAMAAIKLMQPAELAAMLRSPALVPGKDYLVVDVRDDDFEGGNIPGALHLPSHQLSSPYTFDARPHLDQFMTIPKLIFHCAMSQQRGPKAAMLIGRLLTEDAATATTAMPELYVLRGGFAAWQSAYKTEPDLLENYNAKMWEEGWWM
ncbi:hypothetical protein AMAG_01392 [Allomyces macrogynus ATCC 38327]|uniref:protein-tyrosine-phosphatase n=1 Tax=Allomyces macrogynus (strain ATCC 38327) TaxID=578462 RepID=A0A0L0RZN1_ALLM3|nr:hypothetical protein AMAG_01392 [Allomyces macrogynus ATCC 38327]|eukprot:KNE55504.1 hypothetical protein AMAG_01392 [Allomyces macrogynus ATCC 38327]